MRGWTQMARYLLEDGGECNPICGIEVMTGGEKEGRVLRQEAI